MKISSLFIGFLGGLIFTGILGWLIMPGLMLIEHQSPFGVEETVKRISDNAISEDWIISGVTELHKSVKKHGGGDLLPVKLINLCQANHAYNILKDDNSRIVSVMMPCTISVYQKSDGKTYVGTMNAKLLGTMFGGTVAEVMGGEVAEQQQKFIAFVNK